MRDVDAFESAYGRLAATRIVVVAGRADALGQSRPAANRRPGAALSPLLRRLALLAPRHPFLRGARD